MTLEQALLIFTTQLMGDSSYDKQVAHDTAVAVAAVTSDFAEAETLIKIARWESGGFRKDIADCRVLGDNGAAHGLFQVHPFSKKETQQLCSLDYKEQATVALSRVRGSFERCSQRGMKNSDKLTEYTHGHCHHVTDSAAKLRWGNGKKIEKLVYTELYTPILLKKN